MKMAFRSFIRNRKVTIISIAVILAMTIFLLSFSDSIHRNRISLDDAYTNLEVTAHIRGATTQADPYLEETQYKAILESGFVLAHSAMIRFQQGGNTMLLGVTGPDANPMLQEVLPYINWLEGYDEAVLQSEEAFCLAPISSGLELGEERNFHLLERANTVALKVVGLYELEYGGDSSNYFCSCNWLINACRELKIPVRYNSLEMQLGNLQHLDVFKTQMKEIGMDTGSAILVVNDALLREVTSQLNRQIRLLESVLPILLAIVAGIGFGLSFLLLRGRKKEAAVIRSLGMRRWRVAGVFLTETAAQALTGTLAGGLLSYTVLDTTVFQLKYLMLVLVCFLLGGAAAAWKISGVNVFNIMTARE